MTREHAKLIVNVFELLIKETGHRLVHDMAKIFNIQYKHYEYLKHYANGKTIYLGDGILRKCKSPDFNDDLGQYFITMEEEPVEKESNIDECTHAITDFRLNHDEISKILKMAVEHPVPDTFFHCLDNKQQLFVIPYTFETATTDIDNLINKYVTADNNLTCNKITVIANGGVYLDTKYSILDSNCVFVKYTELYNNYKFVNTDIPCGIKVTRIEYTDDTNIDDTIASPFGNKNTIACPFGKNCIVGDPTCYGCDNMTYMTKHYTFCSHK